jgi:predicted enzyme related to lactoylglutathione lyase
MIIESHVAGTPSWIDLMTTDQDSAIAFYGEVFGWQAMVSGPEMGNYAMCMIGDQPVAGIGPIPSEGPPFPPSWSVYISVDDADAVAAAATAAGGQIVAPVMDVAGAGQHPGRMAILAEPSGGVVGLWEPHDHRGSGLVNEPGSFAWNEFLSRDPSATRDFFGTLFGYEWQAMEGAPMEYHSASLAGNQAFGVMGIPPGMPAEVPSHWNTYFAVADTDQSVATALAAGGTALSPAFDSPFGRMAVLADPQGASFSIMAVPSA